MKDLPINMFNIVMIYVQHMLIQRFNIQILFCQVVTGTSTQSISPHESDNWQDSEILPPYLMSQASVSLPPFDDAEYHAEQKPRAQYQNQ